MVIIDELLMWVERDSYAAGSVCEIHYEYLLANEAEDAPLLDVLQVYCEVWGKGRILNEPLGDFIYDQHAYSMTQSPSKQKRHFVVPCHMLDHELGPDKIFIRVFVTTEQGVEISADSAVVNDRF